MFIFPSDFFPHSKVFTYMFQPWREPREEKDYVYFCVQECLSLLSPSYFLPHLIKAYLRANYAYWIMPNCWYFVHKAIQNNYSS